MDMASNDDHRRTDTYSSTRRGVIASIGAALTLPTVPAVVEGSDTTEIPYVVTDDEVLKHKEVPQSWLEHVRNVLQAKADFEKQPSPASGSQSAGIARSSDTYGGKPGLKIQVAANERTQSVTPSEFQGVEVETVDEQDWQNACHYETRDDVVGGLPIEARWEDGGESYTGWGTAGYPVKDGDGNERLLTADHLWENKSCTSSKGEKATQYTQDFGEVAQSEVAPDFALVEKTNDSLNLSSEILEESEIQDVSGWFPEEAVSELVAEGKPVHKMGVTTGKTTGTIDAMNQTVGNGCTNLEGRGVVLNGLDVGDGDSGGPMYRIEDIYGVKYAVLVGHTTHATNINDSKSCVGEERDIGRKAAGHAWFHKNNEYDITL